MAAGVPPYLFRERLVPLKHRAMQHTYCGRLRERNLYPFANETG